MTIVLYFIMFGGLMIFLSQASYAYVTAKVRFERSTFTSSRILPLILPADTIHAIHHCVHAICGSASILAAGSILKPESGLSTQWICLAAIAVLVVDSIIFQVAEKKYGWREMRDSIMHKWKTQKSLDLDHDNEVCLYRSLKEQTKKNLIRDGLHILLFMFLWFASSL